MATSTIRLSLRLRGSAFRTCPQLARPTPLSPYGSRLLKNNPLASSPVSLARAFSLWPTKPKPMNETSSSSLNEFAPEPATTIAADSLPQESVASASTTITPDLPPPPTDVPFTAVDAAEVAQSSILDGTTPSTISQTGDFAAAGLVNWWPAGIVTIALENIHLTTALPWGPTIIAWVVASRLALLPLQVNLLRAQLRMHAIAPQMEKLGFRRSAAVQMRDLQEMARLGAETKELNNKAGVKPSAMLIPALANVTVQLGTFLAVKRICEAQFAPLTVSGLSFLPDLTVPNHLAAVAATSGIILSLQLAKKDILKEQVGHMLNFFQLFSVGGLAFLWHLPAGVNLMIMAGSLFQATQTIILQQPAVRRALNIPIIPPEERPRQPKITELREWPQFLASEARRQELGKREAIAEAQRKASGQP